MLGNQLRALRRSQFLTQKQLAQKLELSEQCISSWETDSRKPSLSSWRRLADALPASRAEIEQLAAGAG